MTATAELSAPQAFSREQVRRAAVVNVPPRSAAGRATDSWDLLLPAVPAGGRIQLTLTDGVVLESRLVEATPDSVVVDDQQILKGRFTQRQPQGTLTFTRAEVARVAMVNAPTNYASTTPNAGVVRMLVSSWGVGTKVDVQTVAAERIRARIVSIEPGVFTVVRETTASKIAYGDVLRLRQDRMRTGAKIAIGAGAVIGALFLAYPQCFASGACLS